MLLIGRRGFERFCGELTALGLEPFALEPLDGLDRVVCDHADTLILRLDKGFLTSRETLDNLPHELREGFYLSEDTPREGYPTDVCFNALEVSGKLFARLDSLSDDAKRLAVENGLKLVNVRQGYAACASLKLGASVVTADLGLCRSLMREGIETLLIPCKGIRLEGCEYGFIGGASVVDEAKRRVIFFGELPNEYSRTVKAFCVEKGYEVTELSGELTDIGGGIFL